MTSLFQRHEIMVHGALEKLDFAKFTEQLYFGILDAEAL